MNHSAIFPQELEKAVLDAFGSVFLQPHPTTDDQSIYGLEGIYSSIYLKGSIAGKLSFFIRPESAARVVAGMLGADEIDPESIETLDGIGEIVNITAGCLKKGLDAHGLKFEISIPSTRLTSVLPPSRWENTIEKTFQAADIFFRVNLNYRIVPATEKPAEPAAAAVAPKLKMSAAELLKAALAKKK